MTSVGAPQARSRHGDDRKCRSFAPRPGADPSCILGRERSRPGKGGLPFATPSDPRQLRARGRVVIARSRTV